jgi:hypothetical protein
MRRHGITLARSAAVAASIGIPALARAPSALRDGTNSSSAGMTSPTSTHALASARPAANTPLHPPTPWPLPFVSDISPDDAEALRTTGDTPAAPGSGTVEPGSGWTARRALPTDPTVGPATIEDTPQPATADAGTTASPASELPRVDLPTPVAVAPFEPPSLSAPPGYTTVGNPVESAEPPGFFPITDPPAAPTFDPSGYTPPLVAVPPEGTVSVPEPASAWAVFSLTTLLLGRRRF